MEVGESTLDTVETLLQGGEGSGQAGTGRIEDSIIGVKMNLRVSGGKGHVVYEGAK